MLRNEYALFSVPLPGRADRRLHVFMALAFGPPSFLGLLSALPTPEGAVRPEVEVRAPR